MENLRDIINTKEHTIQMKEEEIGRIKRLIEMETSEKEVLIKKCRSDIDE